jgi:hypothetical protein
VGEEECEGEGEEYLVFCYWFLVINLSAAWRSNILEASMIKQKLWTILFTLMVLMTSSLVFANADVQWLGKQTVVINHIFEITKPSPNWDTKIVAASETPVGFSLHKSGYNPTILVRLQSSPQGQSLREFAKSVQGDLSVRGVKIDNLVEKNINNSNAILMNGDESGGNAKWLVGVFQSKGVGYVVECMIWSQEFTRYVQDFMKAIDSVRVNG